ncbi:MAG: hypothetical protein FWE95_05350, partial [Planctomycetaceae bacterium]|nr:hypothetical protein [Planctomycetaceae bacterium]
MKRSKPLRYFGIALLVLGVSIIAFLIRLRNDSRNNARQLSPIVDNFTQAQSLKLVLSSCRTKRLCA